METIFSIRKLRRASRRPRKVRRRNFRIDRRQHEAQGGIGSQFLGPAQAVRDRSRVACLGANGTAVPFGRDRAGASPPSVVRPFAEATSGCASERVAEPSAATHMRDVDAIAPGQWLVPPPHNPRAMPEFPDHHAVGPARTRGATSSCRMHIVPEIRQVKCRRSERGVIQVDQPCLPAIPQHLLPVSHRG